MWKYSIVLCILAFNLVLGQMLPLFTFTMVSNYGNNSKISTYGHTSISPASMCMHLLLKVGNTRMLCYLSVITYL